MSTSCLKRTALVLACAALPLGASAAPPDLNQLQAQMRRLTERLDALETENRDLRARIASPKAAPAASADIEQRVKALEVAQDQTEKSLASERISENEPELVTRLKAVEFQTLSMQKQARQIEAIEGISVSASLTGVVQQTSSGAQADPQTSHSRDRTNYRGDVALTLPGGTIGNADGKFFMHARFGQGDGLSLRPTYTSTTNSTAFHVGSGDPSDAQAIVAQAWYQLNVPLPLDGVKRDSRQSASLTVGKIDPFVFFDQNAIADDETVRFMNNAFVHNPLLDSGGDAGVDAYGFTPGMIASYENTSAKDLGWGLSLGMFGSGEASAFNGSMSKPFVIAQATLSPRINALPGNWRAYVWTNGRATDLDDREARHSGFGLSIDQRVSDSLTLFGRYGQQTSGSTRFDRALTGGFELAGNLWGRGADGLGFAAGVLRTSDAFKRASAAQDGAGDIPGSEERNFELYYRWHINSKLSLTPDFQLIQNPGGDSSAKTVKVFGLRARVGF